MGKDFFHDGENPQPSSKGFMVTDKLRYLDSKGKCKEPDFSAAMSQDHLADRLLSTTLKLGQAWVV